MNRQEIAKQLTLSTSLTTSQAMYAVNGIINVITDALASGDSIVLRGFGTLRTVQRAEKVAHDFSTGKTIQIPPCRHVKFIVHKTLHSRINEHER